MVPSLVALDEILSTNTWLLANCFENVEDQTARQRPGGSVNNMAFLAAHVIDARYFLMGILGHDKRSPMHEMLGDVRSLDEAEVLPTVEELDRAWGESLGPLRAALKTATEEQLAAEVEGEYPGEGDDVLSAITFLVQHESYHLGQIALLRRQLGLPAMSYQRKA